MIEKGKDMMRKYGVIVGVLGFLVLAVFINVKINEAASKKASSVTAEPRENMQIEQLGASLSAAESMLTETANYFDSYRVNRENERKLEMEYLDTILNEEKTDVETFQDAQQQKIEIVDNMETEFALESLIKAKGFEDVAVLYRNGSVNVIVQAEVLDDKQVAQILDIVTRETDRTAKDIKITPTQ